METQTGKEGVLGLQDLKKYMQKVNHKIPTSTLKEKFTKYDKNYVNEIGFDDFCSILQEVRFNFLEESNICFTYISWMKENDIRMKENDMTLFFQVLFHRPLFKDLFNEYTSDSKRVSFLTTTRPTISNVAILYRISISNFHSWFSTLSWIRTIFILS